MPTEQFKAFCREHPEIIRELARDGHILTPEFIEICHQHGIEVEQKLLHQNRDEQTAE